MNDLHKIAGRAAAEGRNISEALRHHLKIKCNTPETIELSYNFQAGEYVRFAKENLDHVTAYAEQLARFLDPHLQPGDQLLDVGAGELTTLTHLIGALKTPLSEVYACDISARRLAIGLEYARTHLPELRVKVFTAELSSIPLDRQSVDIVTSNHAVEPNGGREREILGELLRIARRKVVLFEPCYEIASEEGKARMRRHGYIKALARNAESLGAVVEEVRPLRLSDNPLNPTACFVLRRS